jgi:LysM repeat protein
VTRRTEQPDAASSLAAAPPPPQPARAPTNPVPAPAPAPALAETAHPRVYIIQSHDTITSVAARYGLKPATILAANPNINPARLRIGQTLNLP